MEVDTPKKPVFVPRLLPRLPRLSLAMQGRDIQAYSNFLVAQASEP